MSIVDPHNRCHHRIVSDDDILRALGPGALIWARRAYDPPNPSDGLRVLVDRLWPDGLDKAQAALDDWLPEVAPSDELFRWYRYDLLRLEEFGRRYRAELKDERHATAVARLLEYVRERRSVTLLTAAREPVFAHTEVLRKYLDDQLNGRG
jgi:uncharacterized protein YeaO (DUF488 family)